MMLPVNMASRRGGEFLTLLGQFAEDQASHYVAQSQACVAMHATVNSEAMARAEWFTAFSFMAKALISAQQTHIDRVAARKAKGESVFSETDKTVDFVVAATRSAFITVSDQPDQGDDELPESQGTKRGTKRK